MIQHILPKQMMEISEKTLVEVFGFNNNRKDFYNYHHKKLTIGKMIEFLMMIGWNIKIHREDMGFMVENDVLNGCNYVYSELCDGLWEAVKGELLKY